MPDWYIRKGLEGSGKPEITGGRPDTGRGWNPVQEEPISVNLRLFMGEQRREGKPLHT